MCPAVTSSPHAPAADASAVITACCQWLREEQPPPTLAQLAARVQRSPWQLQRLFVQTLGLTPKAWARAQQVQRAQAALHDAAHRSVTEAAYASGYAAASSFYLEAGQRLGMSPQAYRAGGADQQLQVAVAECSLGSVLVAATARGVCCVLLGDDAQALVEDVQARFRRAMLRPGDTAFDRTVAQVVALVEQPQRRMDLPLDLQGTAFQQRVWQALQRIPLGATVSYAQLAAQLGQPTAVRAVAGACAANPMAVLVPCHRVVRHDGGLSGYRWGVERKRALLLREAMQAQVAGRQTPDQGEA